MSEPRKYRVIETTAMGETWWNVVTPEAPADQKDIDERYVVGTFSKSKLHAENFCTLMNFLKTQ